MTSRLHLRFLYCNVAIIVLISIILRASLARTLVACAVGLLVALFFSQIVKVRVVRPIEQLSMATQRMAVGDLSQRVTTEGDEQIATMGSELNSIARML